MPHNFFFKPCDQIPDVPFIGSTEEQILLYLTGGVLIGSTFTDNKKGRQV